MSQMLDYLEENKPVSGGASLMDVFHLDHKCQHTGNPAVGRAFPIAHSLPLEHISQGFQEASQAHFSVLGGDSGTSVTLRPALMGRRWGSGD